MLFIYKCSSFSVPGQKYFQERQGAYLTAFNKKCDAKDKKNFIINKNELILPKYTYIHILHENYKLQIFVAND